MKRFSRIRREARQRFVLEERQLFDDVFGEPAEDAFGFGGFDEADTDAVVAAAVVGAVAHFGEDDSGGVVAGVDENEEAVEFSIATA